MVFLKLLHLLTKKNINYKEILKQKIILILSIALLSIAIYFAFFKDRNSVFNQYNFALKDTSNINLIILENFQNKITLRKQNNKWNINKTYSVNKITIKKFLRTFYNLDFVGKIDDKLKDSISSKLDKKGIKITIKNNKNIISELIIGDVNKYKTGTYIKKTNSNPVIINSTGITNNISQVVSTNSLFWRNKTIFNFNISEIKNIEFYNNKDKTKSFSIKKTKDILILKNFEKKAIEANKNNINRYLSYYRKIQFEKLENNLNNIEKDTIFKNNLAYKIKVTDINNTEYNLKLYYKANTQNKEYKHDINNIYGIYNSDTSLLIIPYYTIDPILKEIDYFFNK